MDRASGRRARFRFGVDELVGRAEDLQKEYECGVNYLKLSMLYRKSMIGAVCREETSTKLNHLTSRK